MAKQASLDSSKIAKFLDLQKALDADFNQMLQLVEKTFHEGPYGREEICQILEISEKELSETLLSQNTQNGKKNY